VLESEIFGGFLLRDFMRFLFGKESKLTAIQSQHQISNKSPINKEKSAKSRSFQNRVQSPLLKPNLQNESPSIYITKKSHQSRSETRFEKFTFIITQD
jgi:hypothetical protein